MSVDRPTPDRLPARELAGVAAEQQNLKFKHESRTSPRHIKDTSLGGGRTWDSVFHVPEEGFPKGVAKRGFKKGRQVAKSFT